MVRRILKWILFVIGLAAFILGAIGIVVPGLPTTPFMIVAAACFMRSSEKFYKMIINNRLFGSAVKDYLAGNGMPMVAKIWAWVMMWIFSMYALIWGIPDRLTYARVVLVVVLIIGTLFILKIPVKQKRSDTEQSNIQE